MKASDLYDYDVSTVKQLGEHTVKVTYTSACRIKGMEDEAVHIAKCSVNTEKLNNNICRARSKVQEMVLCNPWDYWCTFTISPKKYDRYNLKTYFADFSEFLHNYNRRCTDADKVRYILIPEMHKDKAWHMHGFIKGIRKADLYINDNGYLSWKQYADKFGYMSMSKIRSVDRASSYMLKYMTKDIAKNVTDLGAHLYYCSKGLKVAETLYKGHLALHCPWDYEHPDGFCKIKTFDIRKENIEEFIEVLP